MSIIRCGKPCRYQTDGYCQLKGRAPINRNGIRQAGCAYFDTRKER